MKRNEFKNRLSLFLKRRIYEWFEDMPFVKGIALSIVDANINKYEPLIDMLTDENGEVDVNGLINNLSDVENQIKIDLTTISPILPHRVLLIDKKDFNELLKDAN